MYPWEHAAVAYLLYAGYAHWRSGTAPAGWPVLVVLVASQLPDLIDKPLAWQFGLLPSGRSLAHSVFVAVPVVLVVVVLARRRRRPAVGVAFAVGYLSHLVTDVVPVSPGGSLSLESVLWPVVTHESGTDTGGTETGAVAQTGDTLFGAYPSLAAGEPTFDVGVRLGLVALAGVVWLADGRPGTHELRAVGRWAVTAIRTNGRRGRS